MECYKIENLGFSYSGGKKVLCGINLDITEGEFIVLCGKSGCGKSTFLRCLKPSLMTGGKLEGRILFEENDISSADIRTQSAKIGFVAQNPESMIVTDKVWHELAFGLESLGYEANEIRMRVAETASFFGIDKWFRKSISELSGGQKQLLNLASVTGLRPTVLILDEPTAQLDPIAASEFFEMLFKINSELGTTVIIAEHRAGDIFPLADRVLFMESGEITVDCNPRDFGSVIKEKYFNLFGLLPAAAQLALSTGNANDCPLTVKDGQIWLDKFTEKNPLKNIPKRIEKAKNGETAVRLKEVWFRYEKNSEDILRNFSLEVKKGEIFCILGGNGSGKTTALSVISGINIPYRGKTEISGQIAAVPQNPQSLFVKNTVMQNLRDITDDVEKINKITVLCELEEIQNSHPYDISGGEQQRLALAMALLCSPDILLLDEPTKGMDCEFKEELSDILKNLTKQGVTVIMVSHDIEFCAENADRCAMFFDGAAVNIDTPHKFFLNKSFYTTAACRIAAKKIPEAILMSDVIEACGGKIPKKSEKTKNNNISFNVDIEKISDKGKPKRNIFGGMFFVLLLFLTSYLKKKLNFNGNWINIISIAEIFASLCCFFPKKNKTVFSDDRRKINSKQALVSGLMIIIAVPLTVLWGVYFLKDRQYYFVSLLIIAETFIAFAAGFEKRKPQARELVVIGVLCAMAVAGRMVFFMVPQFKPVAAIVIISGVCFGAETGFLVGALTAFVSNMFFGQGVWTPWQMFSFGIIGFLAGIMYNFGALKKNRVSLCIFGFFTVLFIYGGIMNPASVLMWQHKPDVKMITAAYLTGFPFDFIHAVSTVIFLWFISDSMIEKADRIKRKFI